MDWSDVAITAAIVFVFSFLGGLLSTFIIDWPTWRSLLVDIRDHGIRNDR